MSRSRKDPAEKPPPPPIDERQLRESASKYLSRYVPSVLQFRRVLMRKVDRNIRARGGGDRQSAMVLVEHEVLRRIESGALNDQHFAESWTEYLHNKGKSLMQIRGKLVQKGIASELIDSSIADVQREHGHMAFFSACTAVRRRGFGPYRLDVEIRKERRNKDIASLLRAGHGYDTVKEIFSCVDCNELEQLIAERSE